MEKIEERFLVLDPELKYEEKSSKSDSSKFIKGIGPKEAHTIEYSTIDSEFYHQNYMGYLESCYDRHMGIVVSPELIWYVLLSEISGHIKENSERYRSLFTDSDEKKEISVRCPDVLDLPALLVKALKEVVPSETEGYFPQLSTETPESLFAFSAAFCDAVSPYYDDSMYCCGFPSVVVRGSEEDWVKVKRYFKYIARNLELDSHYVFVVESHMNSIIASLKDINSSVAFYKDIFILEHCGSGGQVEVTGWLAQLFMKIPSVRYTHNFSTQLAQLKYKNLSGNRDYQISTGIMKSNYNKETGISVPEFGHVLYRFDEKE